MVLNRHIVQSIRSISYNTDCIKQTFSMQQRAHALLSIEQCKYHHQMKSNMAARKVYMIATS